MYAAHENTYLNFIYRQLNEDLTPPADKNDLCTFIKRISKSTGNSIEKWHGDRCMVDMYELVRRYYYDPYTKGSNSIKYVLPALMNSSDYLQKKYSQSIYGAKGGIKSLNFKDQKWIQHQNGEIIDPYMLLPKMFQDVSERDHILILSQTDELREGGAAMMAYARLQFEDISEYERDELRKALLKYCELDTLAMVMIYEAWREMI